MLGQPFSLLLPRVVGIELIGALPEGTTATDLVLTVAQMLRKHGVVGKFVEFYGDGVGRVPLENRATIGNMSPEYGSTCTIFPIDDETLRYLRATGRPDDLVALVETYAKEQGMWHDPAARPVYDEHLRLDLSTVEPSIAGTGAPAGSGAVVGARGEFEKALLAFRKEGEPVTGTGSAGALGRREAGARRRCPGGVVPCERPAGVRRRPAVGTSPTRRANRHERASRCWSTRQRCPVTLADGRDVRDRRRSRRDRRDHVVHEHVEPVGDDRGGPAGAERGRARADRAAVGEDVAGTRFARGHRLLRTIAGLMAPLVEARLRRRRLRLHDVHRELRAARARDLARSSTRAICRCARCCRATATSRAASIPTAG